MRAIWTTIKVLFKCVLAVVMAAGIFYGLDHVFYNREVDRGIAFHSLPENSMDVIVLGSSHAQYSFQPNFFREETGLYSVVMGSACQPLEVSVEMLKEAYKTQSPKLVILEVYTAMPLKSLCHADSCYVIAEYQMRGQERYRTISYLPEEKAAQYRNDFAIYHNDWKTIEDLSYFEFDQLNFPEPEIDQVFGYVYNEPVYPISNYWLPNTAENDVEYQLSPPDEDSLNRIAGLCREHGSELMLYKAPMDSVDEENNGYLAAVGRWAAGRNIPFFNYMRKAGEMEYYLQVHGDYYHSYVHGAHLITKDLAEQVKASGIVFQHRDEPVLNRKYRDGVQWLTAAVMNYEWDPYKVLSRLAHAEGYEFVAYRPGRRSDPEVIRILKEQLPDFDETEEYYAVLKDGAVYSSSSFYLQARIADQDVQLSAGGLIINGTAYENSGGLWIGYGDEELSFLVSYPIRMTGRAWKEGGSDYRDSIVG